MKRIRFPWVVIGLLMAGCPAQAGHSGNVDFRLTGILPSTSFGASLDLEFLTCENHSGKITLNEDKDWHRFEGPLTVDMGNGPSCPISMKVEDNRNVFRYFGSATCTAQANMTTECVVPICRQTNNGPPECP